MRWPKWYWDLRDAWRADKPYPDDLDLSRDEVLELMESGESVELVEPLILDPLFTFVADEPALARELAPEEEARIRKIVSDSLWAEREGKVFPRCEDHLDGMDGAAVFFCDRSSGHGGFHRDRENKVTWVSDGGGK